MPSKNLMQELRQIKEKSKCLKGNKADKSRSLSDKKRKSKSREKKSYEKFEKVPSKNRSNKKKKSIP